ncbi:MAG: sulfite exporter TauE/SafE family protein [Thiotrichales bacterium]
MTTELTLAFFAGLSGYLHCVSMCGGLASGCFAMLPGHQRLTGVVLYHGMRIFSYALLGMAGALLTHVVAQSGITGKIQGILQISAGLALITLGILQIWRGNRKRFPVSKQAAQPITFQVNPDRGKNFFWTPAAAGFTNGLIPCALVFSIAIKASQTSILDAALLMIVFGLGTLPALLSLSAFGLWIRSWRAAFGGWLAGVIVIVFGIWTAYEGIRFFQIIRGLSNW